MKEAISLPLLGTYYFNNNDFYTRLIVADQNKNTQTRTLYILKRLYTWCSTEEAITSLSLCIT